MESDTTLPITVAAATPKKNCQAGECKELPTGDDSQEILQLRCSRHIICSGTTQQSPAATTPYDHNGSSSPIEHQQQNAGESIQETNVSNLSLDNMLRVVTLV
jgi:hypothetical protein